MGIKYVCVCVYVCMCVCMDAKLLHLWLHFATLWTVACQGFSRQGYWSGLPCLPAGNLPDSIKLISLMSPALAGRFFPTSATCKAKSFINLC